MYFVPIAYCIAKLFFVRIKIGNVMLSFFALDTLDSNCVEEGGGYNLELLVATRGRPVQ